MTREDLLFDLEPFTDEIRILVEMPGGVLKAVDCCYYRNIDGEGFAVIKPSPSDE